MTFLTQPEIILYSDTRKENSTNFIFNFEKCIFLHILCKPQPILLNYKTINTFHNENLPHLKKKNNKVIVFFYRT